MSYKIIVAHPGRQHSFRTAVALKNNDMLCKYVTTIYDSENSLLMKSLKKLLPKGEAKRAAGRKIHELPDSDVQCFCQISGLIEIALNRADSKRKIYRWWHDRTADRFGEKVALLAIKEKANAVIMYDTTATKCFELLRERAPNIVRIIDCSAANRLYMRTVYEDDMRISPECAERLQRERGHLLDNRYCEQLERELRSAELFLAPSNFVRKSLIYSGVDENQIAICPYGTNFEPELNERQHSGIAPLKLLYVGNVTAMKGVHYLLKAVQELGDKVQLTIVGAYDNSDHWLDPYMENCKFVGRVPHEKVKEYLKAVDVFVFPSLGEGLSLSVLEAMSHGLACIVTENSGANDAIFEGINGFVIKPQSIEAIKEKIIWCNNHRNQLSVIGRAACKTAQKYSWKTYEENLVHILQSKLKVKEMHPNLTIYSENELKKVHELELEALQEVIRICNAIKIDYFIIDGAAIGAMRHQGFIPWDDDIDVGMTREAYQKFLKEAPNLLSEKYYLQTPYDDKKSPYFYSKLRINGTEFVEYCNRKLKTHHGIYIDICPFDMVPDDETLNKKQFRRCQFLIRLFVLRQSPELSRAPTTAKKKMLAVIRLVLHNLMRLVPYQLLASMIEAETTKYNGTNQKAYSFLHYPKRNVDCIRVKELFPVEERQFDGININVPHDCDSYLRRHYGNYMEWPEPGMRYGHKPYKFRIDEDVGGKGK